MATYIGLLRAVNLPGHNKIAMADLRDVLTRLGMRDVVTLLQSGNFVCRSDVRSSPELERLIEETATKQLGLITDVLVRSDKEWNTLIAESTDAAPASPTKTVSADRASRAPLSRTSLGRSGTARNWNSGLKLAALASGWCHEALEDHEGHEERKPLTSCSSRSSWPSCFA